MQDFLTCWEAIELYEEYIRATQPSQKAEHILNELRCAILRFWSPQFRLAGTPSGRKMTKAEVESAKAFLKTVGIEVLLTARETLHLAFESQNVSIASAILRESGCWIFSSTKPAKPILPNRL